MKYNLNKIKIVGLIALTVFILVIKTPAFSQSENMITKEYDQLSWTDFINKIEQSLHVQFYFDKESIPNFKISIKNIPVSLINVLTDNLKPFNIFVSIDDNRNIFLTKEESVVTDLPPGFFKKAETVQAQLDVDTLKPANDKNFLKTTTAYITQTFVVGTREKGANKKEAVVSGHIKNSENGEPIVGATIFQEDLKTGIATNDEGFFSLTIGKGKHNFTINSINSIEKKIEVEVLSDGAIDISLDPKIFLLDDIIVSAQNYSKVRGMQMGIEKTPIVAVKKIPLVFGEHDILKVALLLPGIQTVGEGSSGFNVRGSPTDENVFYINNAPIYNTSHVAGFFSAFNSDAIDEFSLYKNNIPINYGGRLASVFDITTKKGSTTRTTANGGIGFITGRLLVEGPIKKDQSSFLVAVRSTYSDWVLGMVKDKKINQSKVNFADAITNLSFQIDKNDQLNVFSYYSNDVMDLATKTKYDYQNYSSSIIWKHYFKSKHSFELSLAHSSYDFNEENSEIESFSYKHLSKLKHTEISTIFNLIPNVKHNLILGTNAILYQINRGNPMPLSSESQFKPLILGREKGLESGFFISDEWKISSKFSVTGGLRYNIYDYLGPQKVFDYLDGFPKTEASIQDTLFFGKNKIVKSHQGLDSRFAANYMVNDDLSFKIAYNRLHQYIYMLSNTVAISPNYKWKLSDYNTKPMIGDQFSAGIFANVFANRYELSVEGYYKKIKNFLELKNGASLFLNEFVERSTLQGKLDTYGIEFMLKKLYGSITGWINYTYSKSSVLVDSEFSEDRINFGMPYPSNYDKPHALNMVVNRNFSKRFNMSANFVYSTGRPTTLPISIFYQNGIKYLNYSKRNENRIPDYIRLDVSFSLEGNLRRKKIAHGSWNFSIYNLLGRKNAYSVYYVKENEYIKGYKLSIFGSPIYSLTYNFKLGNYDN